MAIMLYPMMIIPGSTPNIILTGFCKEKLFLPLMRWNKSIKIFFNYFLGPLLFGWLALSIYREINNQPQLEASWQHIRQSFYSYKAIAFVAVLLLMLVNWGIEAYKWKLAVSPIYPLSFMSAYKAVLSGVSFSVTMPNRTGEYVGRLLYLPEGSRLKTISVTVVSSISQLFITLLCGAIALIALKEDLIAHHIVSAIAYQFVLYGLLLVLLLLALLYFRISGIVKIFQYWFQKSRHLYLVQTLQAFRWPLLVQLLLLSLLRYSVFIFQYILLFRFFNVYVPVLTIAAVMSLVFVAMAVIPTIALVEVGLRGQISIQMMGMFTTASLGVGLTTVSVWFINLILPAIIGSLFVLGIKVFKRRNEID